MSGVGDIGRLTRRAVIGAAGSLLLPGAARAQQRRPPPRVGVLLSARGAAPLDFAQLGAEIGAELSARRGRPLALRFAAPSDEAEHAQRAVTRLLDDGAEVILSTGGDASTAAALSVTERRGVPLVISAATAPGLTDRGARLVVRTAPTMSQLLGRGLGLLRDLHAAAALPLPRRLALLYVDDATGAMIRSTVAAVLPATNLPLESYSEIAVAPLPDVPGMFARLRAADADVILIETPPATAAAVVGGLAGNGVRPTGIVSVGLPGMIAAEVLALPDGAADNHVTFAPWPDPRSPVTMDVRGLFARHNPPARFALAQGELALSVDAVLLIAEALARHPAARGQALGAALRGTVLAQKMMHGPPMRFDARGQNVAMPSVALQNRAGTPRVVLPRHVAEAEQIWPNPALSKT
jgi:ABC-type branched-subunit amino acid transport system substrate-binding protein